MVVSDIFKSSTKATADAVHHDTSSTAESPASAAPPPAAPAPPEDRTGEDRTEGDATKYLRERQYNSIGFTNKMCIGLVGILFIGLCMGFALALYSVREQYTGALECFTIAFTPMGVGINVVLTRAVMKSDHENTGADGEGIKYGYAKEEWQ